MIEALAVHPRQPSGRRGGRKAGGVRRRRRSCRNSTTSPPSRAAATSEAGSRPGSRAPASGSVWRKLIGRRAHPDEEPGEIAWLRAYSNYLTPKLGLFSADTWTAVALYVRNLILNWLVILPAICPAAVRHQDSPPSSAYWALSTKPRLPLALRVVAVLLMVVDLALRHAQPPDLQSAGPAASPPRTAQACRRKDADAHRNEMIRMAAGRRSGERSSGFACCRRPRVEHFCLRSISWSRGFEARQQAGVVFPDARRAPCRLGALRGVLAGGLLPWSRPRRAKRQRHVYWLRDLIAGPSRGGVYGALMGLGAYLCFLSPDHDLPQIPRSASSK